MAITAAANIVVVDFIAFFLGYGLSPNWRRQAAVPTCVVSSPAVVNAPRLD
jgi:hypothetical protein